MTFSSSLCYRRHTRAFALVETLVAIAILVVGIVGPMSIAARSLQTAFYAREEMMATYLAQEGLEIVRRHRDSFVLENSTLNTHDWLPSISSNTCTAPNGCGVDWNGDLSTARSCSSAANCRLYFDENSGLYSYESGTLSPFTRTIWISGVDSSRRVAVWVEVSWESGLFRTTKKVQLTSTLMSHYESGY